MLLMFLGAKDAAKQQKTDDYELVMEEITDMFVQAQTLAGTLDEEDQVKP